MEGPDPKPCDCDPGCPCDFDQAPTHGHRHGCGATQIDRRHYGDVSLDGLRRVFLARWPGLMDEGDGDPQLIIDEWASDEQFLRALTIILRGRAGETLYETIDVVCPHKHDSIRAPIRFDRDIEQRSATARAGDVFETRRETLREVDPRDPYRARMQARGGFEYTSADETAEIVPSPRSCGPPLTSRWMSGTATPTSPTSVTKARCRRRTSSRPPRRRDAHHSIGGEGTARLHLPCRRPTVRLDRQRQPAVPLGSAGLSRGHWWAFRPRPRRVALHDGDEHAAGPR